MKATPNPRLVRLLIALAVVAILIAQVGAPLEARERGLAIFDPGGIDIDGLTGGEPIEPGETYVFDVSVAATVPIEDAMIVVGRSELTIEVEPERFDLVPGEPQDLTISVTMPPAFSRRPKASYTARLRVQGPTGPLAGSFTILARVTDPEIRFNLSPPLPDELTAGSVYVGQLSYTTTRDLSRLLILSDRGYVTVGRPDPEFFVEDIGTVPITISAPLRPKGIKHSVTIRALNNSQRIKHPLSLRFNVKKLDVTWEDSTIELTLMPGEPSVVETFVTLSGSLPRGTVRVKASELASVTSPFGATDFSAGIPKPIEITVQAPFNPGTYRSSVVVGRGGETLDSPLILRVRVERDE